jgi:hypothetical protein
VLQKDNMATCVMEPLDVLRLARRREISLQIVILSPSSVRGPGGGMPCAALCRRAGGVALVRNRSARHAE